jgi:hypothetical protein
LASRFRDLWHLLHEGGLVIETRAVEQPAAPLALRTVLQLDGDRMISVDLSAIAALSQDERLRLMDRHRRDVLDKTAGVFGGLNRGLFVLRAGLLAGAGVGAVGGVTTTVIAAAGVAPIGVIGLAYAQLPWVAPLLCHWLLPYGMRAVWMVTTPALRAARRAVSAEVYARMVRGEPILPLAGPDSRAAAGS